MDHDNSAIVTAFVKEWDGPSVDPARLIEYFTDDAVYHNIPAKPMNGKEAIAKGLAGIAQMQSNGWEIVNQVASGNVVMNERVDRFTVNGKKVDIPVVGVFELRDGKISAWRDYFDMAMFQSQMS